MYAQIWCKQVRFIYGKEARQARRQATRNLAGAAAWRTLAGAMMRLSSRDQPRRRTCTYVYMCVHICQVCIRVQSYDKYMVIHSTFEADNRYADRFRFSNHRVAKPNSTTLGNMRQRLLRPDVITWYHGAITSRFDKCRNRLRCRDIVLRDYRLRSCAVQVSVAEADFAL